MQVIKGTTSMAASLLLTSVNTATFMLPPSMKLVMQVTTHAHDQSQLGARCAYTSIYYAAR